MKKCLSFFLLCVMLVTSAGIMPVSASDIKIGDELDRYIAENSYETDGVTMAPLRDVSESLGAEVSWNFLTQTATVTLGEVKIKIKEDTANAVIGDAEITMPQPAKVNEGRIYAPLRFVAENLGFGVVWNEETGSVHITTEVPNDQPADIGHFYDIVAVSASNDDGNKPEGVLDRNYQTRWSSEDTGAYITLEMDDIHPVAYIGVAVYKGDERQQTLSVQISEDGVNYKEVVTKYVTPEFTPAMCAVDLGGTYDAKFVRVLGYGNSTNYWNSFTEISVYAPMEDGSMPVATDAPTGISKRKVEDLPKEQQEELAKLDRLYDGLDKWLANLYHHEDGGFYMTMSGRDDPDIECGIEMSAFAYNSIGYSDASSGMPDSVKEKFTQYLIDRQDPKTGLFIDKQGMVNDREVARNQSSALNYVNKWKIQLPYEHPSQKAKDGNTTSADDTTVMPAYMSSTESYVQWIESWNWDTNSWTAGDQVSNSITYINYLPEDQKEKYKKVLFDWLEKRQDPETGYWSPNLDFNAVSGAFKVGLTYEGNGMRIPNADKVMETTIRCMEQLQPTVAHYVRNPITLLYYISSYDPEYKERIQQAIMDNMDTICGWVEQFLAPDGGFAQYHGKSMSNFGGIYGSHQLWEGDVDSTVMILTVRNEVYGILGISTPPLKFDPDFWNWIEGTVETPSPYADKSVLESNVNSEDKRDFENVSIGNLSGEEFGGTPSEMTAKIVKDTDRPNNQCLELSYDGTKSSGPKYSVMGEKDSYQVLYRPGIAYDTVVEFDLKLKNMGGNNSCYISLGGSEAYNLNLQRTNMGIRIDSVNVHYGGTIATLRENEWYRIRVEYHTGADKSDFKAKVYVDGELVSINQSYAGMLTSVPGDAYGGISLTWYRAGSGTVLLDNIEMSKQSI